MERNADDESDKLTPRALLGRRLRRLREHSELSVRGLAEQVGYPFGYISRVENGKQLPSDALAEAFDSYFDADGLFVELLEMSRDTLIAASSRAVVSKEPEAERIQVFTSSLVPGLLQTPDYARELFRYGLPGMTEEEIDERVAVRMRRKRVFEGSDAPFYWAIMDEAALKRPVGSLESMCEQLHQVLRAAKGSRVNVQVLPFAQGPHSMLGGSLTLLTLREGGTIGVVESFITGEPVDSPKRILELTQLFDVARSLALPEDASLDLVRRYLKEYEHERDS